MAYEQEIHKAALALGAEIAETLKPARDWQARAQQLGQELDALRAREESAYATTVDALAAGKLTAAQVPSKAPGIWVYDSRASQAVVSAQAACHRSAAAAGREAAPRLFQALATRVDQVVAESVTLAATVPAGVHDELAALQSGNGDAKVLRTWRRLVELTGVWESCHELNRLCQRAGWLPGPSHPKDRTFAWTFQAYRVPHRLTTIKGRVSPEQHLAAAVAVGAEPGLYSWSDATARARARDRREYRPMETITRHNSLGNPVASQSSEPLPLNQADYAVNTKTLIGG